MACDMCGDPGIAAGLCQPCKDATDNLIQDLTEGKDQS